MLILCRLGVEVPSTRPDSRDSSPIMMHESIINYQICNAFVIIIIIKVVSIVVVIHQWVSMVFFKCCASNADEIIVSSIYPLNRFNLNLY